MAATPSGLKRRTVPLAKGDDTVGPMRPSRIQELFVSVLTKKSRATCSMHYSLDYSTEFSVRVAVVASSLQPFQQMAVPHAVACLIAKYRVEHPCDKPLRCV